LDASTAVKAASDVNLSFVNFARQLQYAADHLVVSSCIHVNMHAMPIAHVAYV
jgi:hypothetical protein